MGKKVAHDRIRLCLQQTPTKKISDNCNRSTRLMTSLVLYSAYGGAVSSRSFQTNKLKSELIGLSQKELQPEHK